MWNNNKSLSLSILSVRLFFIVWIIFCVGGYPITQMYVEFVNHPELFLPILITLYACLGLSIFTLYYLHQLLVNIKKDIVFEDVNVRALRIISWLCMAIGVVTCISAFFYIQFLLVSASFAFIALIVRIVKNVVAQAIYIKQENDYTI